MTSLAKSYSIGNIKPKFWKLRKWLYVMSLNIASPFVTFLTSKIVPPKHGLAPRLTARGLPNNGVYFGRAPSPQFVFISTSRKEKAMTTIRTTNPVSKSLLRAET
jgi:hypothetical protein